MPGASSLTSIAYYNSAAAKLADLYESASFAQIHRDVLDLLPVLPARAADIGAGSGRDAAALATMGYQVTAVEPSVGLLAQARRRHSKHPILWVEDALPRLEKLAGERFQLVLVSAVWMHLAPNDREPAMARLRDLLLPKGLFVLTLREGPADAERSIYSIEPDDIEVHARTAGFEVLRRLRREDELGRGDIHWTTFALA